MTVPLSTLLFTYKRPALFARAMRSVLEQDWPDFQLRIYDNASSDGTAEVAAALAQGDPRVRYHCHDTNIGSSANFQYGLARVDTPFFTILSDDDYLLPGMYRRAMAGFAAHPDAMFWGGLTLNVDEQGTIWDARVRRWPREGLYRPPDGALHITGGMSPTWTGIVFRRELLASIGPPDPEAPGPADLDFVLKAAALHPFVIDKAPSAVFTLNTQSYSATQPLSAFWPGWQKMFRNLAGLPGLPPEFRRALLDRLHADARRMLLRRGANALAQGRVDFARDAADALVESYRAHGRAALLRTLAWGCSTMPRLGRLYAAAYRLTERRIVDSRAELQAEFGHLLRHA